MNDRFLHIESYARTQMIEQIMALIGRASSDPRSYRRTLESWETATLRRTLNELLDSSHSEFRAPRSEIFPAQPSLTETAGVIASADTGHAPDSARDFTLQSALNSIPE